MSSSPSIRIYTIGHSSHDLLTFFSHLRRYQIERIVDIRRSPRSQRYPHFNGDALETACRSSGTIDYSFQGDLLGARRRRRKSLGDLNAGLTDSDDRAYADYLQGKDLRWLICESPVTVLMCSENDPGQCHRSLLADHLSLVHQVEVMHILSDGDLRFHQVHRLAQLNEEKNACIYSALTLNQADGNERLT